MFRVRIDQKSDLDIPHYMETIGAKTLVLFHHVLPHGNPHFHAYIEIEKPINALRDKLKKDLKVTGSLISVKQCDPSRVNEYLQYNFHKKHGNIATLIYNHNFDNQLLHKLQIQAQSVADEYHESKTTKRNSKLTIFDIAQKVQELFQGTNYLEGNNLHQYGTGRADDFPEEFEHVKRMITVYTDIAIEVLRQEQKAFDEFLLRKVITTAMSITQDGKYILRQKMIKNFSHLY